AGYIRATANRKHNLVSSDCALVRKARDEFFASLLNSRDSVAASHGDAATLHFTAQMLSHVVIESTEDILSAIDERNLAAQPGKNAGELDGDIAAALHHNASRQFGQMKGLIRRDCVFYSRNARPHMRPCAGRNQNRFRPHARTRCETNSVRVLENSTRLH